MRLILFDSEHSNTSVFEYFFHKENDYWGWYPIGKYIRERDNSIVLSYYRTINNIKIGMKYDLDYKSFYL